jgi:hypothetical protein
VKWLVAVLGVLWALGNLGVAYLFFTSGIAAKNVHKGLGVQASLVVAAAFVGLFAVLLLAQGVSLARARHPD